MDIYICYIYMLYICYIYIYVIYMLYIYRLYSILTSHQSMWQSSIACSKKFAPRLRGRAPGGAANLAVCFGGTGGTGSVAVPVSYLPFQPLGDLKKDAIAIGCDDWIILIYIRYFWGIYMDIWMLLDHWWLLDTFGAFWCHCFNMFHWMSLGLIVLPLTKHWCNFWPCGV